MNAQYMDKCLVAFKKHGLDVSRLEKVTQGSECDLIEDRSSFKEMLPNHLVPGQCPVVDEKALWAEQKPNHPKYAGRWFEVARSENVFQLVKQCTKSDLTYKNEGFHHITTGLDQTSNPISREGLTYESTTGPNKETPHLSIQFEQPSFAAPYVVLDTDYVNYSCIYSCIDINQKFRSDFMFIWSRTPTMNAKYLDKCLVAFRKHGLDVNRLEKVTQGSDCDSNKEL